MRAYLFSTEVLVSASAECLILNGNHGIGNGLMVERIHMFLELEVHWALISALIILKKVLLLLLLLITRFVV